MLFADIQKLSENDRIDMIGNTIMANDAENVIGVIVESDAKADRYIKKILHKFQLIRHIDTLRNVPYLGCITLRFGMKLQ